MTVSIIAAVAANGVIGRSSDNTIPWRIPEDFKHFKAETVGAVVIMGRNTWESLPKRPLPDRENIVIYDINKGFPSDGEHYSCHSLRIAVNKLAIGHLEATKVFIIGGAQIYAEAMSVANELVITHISNEYDGDVLFPLIDQSIWEVTKEKTLTPEATVKYYKRRA